MTERRFHQVARFPHLHPVCRHAGMFFLRRLILAFESCLPAKMCLLSKFFVFFYRFFEQNGQNLYLFLIFFTFCAFFF